jgi:antitoxin MazE
MKVARWGNSLAVRLPKAVVERLDLTEGDDLTVVLTPDGDLILGKEPPREIGLMNFFALSREAPAGFRFDRDEANER